MNTATQTLFNSTTSMLATGLFAFICSAGGGRALAAEPAQPLTKTVHFGDLNLDSEQGAQALYVRLRGAAKEVCSPLESIELARRMVWETCINNAVADAVQQVDKTMLSALHVRAVNRSKS